MISTNAGTAWCLAAALALLAGIGLGPSRVGATSPAAPPAGPCRADAAGPPGARMFWKLDPQGIGRVSLAAFLAHRDHRFESLDADDDGRVSWREFAARHASADAARTKTSFQRFDGDRDGFITRAEWRAGETERFERIDADHDGFVSRGEFLADRRRVCASRRVTATAAGGG